MPHFNVLNNVFLNNVFLTTSYPSLNGVSIFNFTLNIAMIHNLFHLIH